MLTTLALLVPLLVPTSPATPAADVRTRYVELVQKDDATGCQELWRKERGAILPTIDADLEGSLKVREDAKGRASEEAAKIIASARAEAEQESVKAREALREQVAGLAVKGAEAILRKEVNASVHAELLGRLKAEL